MTLNMVQPTVRQRNGGETKEVRQRRNRAEFHLGRIRAAKDRRSMLAFVVAFVWAVGSHLSGDALEAWADSLTEQALERNEETC